jgi:hypothetical protein
MHYVLPIIVPFALISGMTDLLDKCLTVKCLCFASYECQFILLNDEFPESSQNCWVNSRCLALAKHVWLVPTCSLLTSPSAFRMIYCQMTHKYPPLQSVADWWLPSLNLPFQSFAYWHSPNLNYFLFFLNIL